MPLLIAERFLRVGFAIEIDLFVGYWNFWIVLLREFVCLTLDLNFRFIRMTLAAIMSDGPERENPGFMGWLNKSIRIYLGAFFVIPSCSIRNAASNTLLTVAELFDKTQELQGIAQTLTEYGNSIKSTTVQTPDLSALKTQFKRTVIEALQVIQRGIEYLLGRIGEAPEGGEGDISPSSKRTGVSSHAK